MLGRKKMEKGSLPSRWCRRMRWKNLEIHAAMETPDIPDLFLWKMGDLKMGSVLVGFLHPKNNQKKAEKIGVCFMDLEHIQHGPLRSNNRTSGKPQKGSAQIDGLMLAGMVVIFRPD